MKKSILKTLAALILTASVTSAYALDATVMSTKGKAEVQKGNSWVALKPGSKLTKGDVVQTGFKSELKLKIGESTVEVAPMTRITIEQLAAKDTKDETSLYLDTGSVKSDVKKTDKRRVGFTVRSPAATASVRGTTVNVATGYRKTDVQTIAGKVEVFPTSVKEATISTDEQDKAPASSDEYANGPVDGNGSPKGARYVNAGQSSTVNADGSSESSLQKAKNNALNTGAAPSVTSSHKPATSSKGSLTIKAKIE